MKIILTSVHVSDQAKALEFYTQKLGFVKKEDVPADAFRWLTVVSPDAEDGTELFLEPNDNPVAQAYQKGIFEQGIAANSFGVEDVHEEYERLTALGVEFTMKPTDVGTVIIAMINDTCGNLIQLMQRK